MVLMTAGEALKLPRGKLAVLFSEGVKFESSFTVENVVGAADLIIKKNPETEVYSQAGVIVQAGKLGWGLGDVYSTF